MFALGLLSWMYGRPDRGARSRSSRSGSPSVPDIRDANITAFKAGWNFGETTEDVRGPATRSSRPRCRPAPTATSPATWRWPTAWSPPACSPGCRCSSAPTRSRRPRDILHELSKHKAFGVTHLPGRGRDRRRRRRARRVVRRRARRHHHVRPGHRAEVRDDRPRGDDSSCRCSSSTCSAAAPRPGCRPRPSRPTCCRRCSAATARRPVPIVAPQSPGDCFDAALEAARIAVTYRTPVMLLSDGYLANGSEPWRIPDVDDLPDDRPGVRDRAQPRRRRRRAEFWPYLRDPETLARPWAIPGTPGPRAPHRRPREGRRHRQHLLRPGQPRLHGPHPPGQGRPDRRHASRRSRSTTPTATAKVLVLGWGSTYGPIGAGVPPGAQGRATRSPRPTCATSTRSRTNLGDILRALRQGADPRDEPRPARAAAARPSTSSTRSATTRSAGCRSRPPSSPRRSASWSPRPRASTST